MNSQPFIEHAHPTVSTVKYLYATAFSCAYPNCAEPLYREDKLAEAWILNSRVCHIHARSENGPRWDASQTPEENRHYANLVLMCIPHSSAIDDARSASSYSPDLLRQWKAAQVAEHDARRQGWPLTERMAQAAIGLSFSQVGVVINNSTVDLRGEGGRAPGAGGGGGGAIGQGARGGRGGEGGLVRNADGAPLSENAIAEFVQMALGEDISGPPPGAGGGGAGAIGDGAVGGDGGGGGDGVFDTLAVEAGDQIEVQVGSGGTTPRLPGVHPTAGGDSVLTIRSAAGVLKRTIRASGGTSAKAGRLPEDWETISLEDLSGGFAISSLLVASFFEVRHGLLSILSGGWTEYTVPTLPFETIWPVHCFATWRSLSGERTRGLQLCLTNPDDEEVSRFALELPPTSPDRFQTQWWRDVGAPLDRIGRWSVSVVSGEFLLSEIFIEVNLAPAIHPA